MIRASFTLLSGISAFVFATPAVAQHDHGAMVQSAATCTPDHAAMGHCEADPVSRAQDGQRDHSTHDALPAANSDHIAHHSPSLAADHDGHKPVSTSVSASEHEAVQAGVATCTAEHAAMGHCSLEGGNASLPQIGTNLPAGDAPAPPPPSLWMADAIWGKGAMAHSRHMMMVENGGQTFTYASADAEYVSRQGRDGFSMSGKFWYGGDINRVTVRADLSGSFGEGVEDADVELLYSRPIDAYFNLQAGMKQDVGKGPKRSYATIGFEGLAPYWFEVEGAIYLSDKGDVTAHLEAEYDQRITQKLVIQPAFELGLSAQDIADAGKGSGITEVGAALRLRYEFVRSFAPYVGVSWTRKIGGTADYARGFGDKVEATNFLFGLKTWF